RPTSTWGSRDKAAWCSGRGGPAGRRGTRRPEHFGPSGRGAEMNVFKEFTFEAAHRLPNVPADHKCARLHGHSFSARVTVSGPVGGESGWVVDFADIADAFEPLHRVLDHNYLNEIDGL